MDASLTAGGEWSAVHARQEGLQVQAVGACGVVAAVVVLVYRHTHTAAAGGVAGQSVGGGEDQAGAEATDDQREAGAV